MNKTFAVLSYPNSNNLGDFIQSEAVKQYFKNQIIQELDRDQLHTYKGPKVFVFMNGWFMEKPSNWPPSNNINPFFVSFHLNPASKKMMLSKTGVKYLKKYQPIGCRDTYTQKILSNCGIETYFSACLTLTLKRYNFVPKNTKRQGILVISPMERLISKNFDESRFTLKTVFNKIKNLKKNRQYLKAMKRLNSFLSKQKDPVYFKSQLLDPKKFSEKERSNFAIEQLKDIAKDFVKVAPISKLPIKPGPQVAAKKSILFGLKFGSLNSLFVISCNFSRCDLEANSGTTPPCCI